MQEIVNTVPLFATLALVVNAFTVRLSITSTLKMYVYLFGNCLLYTSDAADE